MEPSSNQIETLVERVEAYASTSFELSKLRVVEQSIPVVTLIASKLSVIAVLAFFSVLLTIGLALFLGELMGKSYYGFFAVAGFYLVLGIILQLFLSTWIRKPISDLFISKFIQPDNL